MRFSRKKVAITEPSAARITLCSEGLSISSSAGSSLKIPVVALATAPMLATNGTAIPARSTPPVTEATRNASSMARTWGGRRTRLLGRKDMTIAYVPGTTPTSRPRAGAAEGAAPPSTCGLAVARIARGIAFRGLPPVGS